MTVDLNSSNTNIPQGWQCPCCERIYSPSISICFFCNGASIPNANL